MKMKKKSARPLISVLIPVFNEEKNIRPAFDAVTAQFEKMQEEYRLEIIFSDNHSTDGTERELEKLSAENSNVKVIRLARNFGFQRSVLTAYRYASGAAAIQIDCDLQDPPEIFPAFLEKWKAGHDVVVGIRRKREESWLLRTGRRLFYRLVTAISDDNIVDNAGDFRLVDRSAINRLAKIHDARPYTRGLVSSLAARQTGVEYDRQARKFESSKFPLRRLLGFATDGIVSHSLFPLRLASVVGFAIFLFSLVVALYYILAYLIADQAWPAGFATVVILLLMSLGLNAMFIGIVGEYVGRIYDQVRERPLSIVEHTINFESEKQKKNPSAKETET